MTTRNGEPAATHEPDAHEAATTPTTPPAPAQMAVKALWACAVLQALVALRFLTYDANTGSAAADAEVGNGATSAAFFVFLVAAAYAALARSLGRSSRNAWRTAVVATPLLSLLWLSIAGDSDPFTRMVLVLTGLLSGAAAVLLLLGPTRSHFRGKRDRTT